MATYKSGPMFVEANKPWPIKKCAVVGCVFARHYDEEPQRNGLIRRWCKWHAELRDEAARLEGGQLIEVNFGKVSE